MKNIAIHALVLAVSLAAFSDAASAGRINHRQGHQRARIQQGVKSGELTRGEAARTRAEQRHVRRMERRAKADGQVTDEEQAKINHEQNRASRQIHRLKHNDNTQPE